MDGDGIARGTHDELLGDLGGVRRARGPLDPISDGPHLRRGRRLCVTSDPEPPRAAPPSDAGRPRCLQPASTTAPAGLLMEGRLAEARVEFWQEVDAADEAGEPVALAEAAIGLGGVWVHEHRATVERARVRAVQRRALARSAADDLLAGRLRARLAAEQAYVDGDAGPVLAEVANARRRSGDPVALAEALSIAHHCLLGPAAASTGLALADELIETAPRSAAARSTR